MRLLRSGITLLEAAKIDFDAAKWAKDVLDIASEANSKDRLKQIESNESLALDLALMIVAIGFECGLRGSKKRSREILDLVPEIGTIRAYGKLIKEKEKKENV